MMLFVMIIIIGFTIFIRFFGHVNYDYYDSWIFYLLTNVSYEKKGKNIINFEAIIIIWKISHRMSKEEKDKNL